MQAKRQLDDSSKTCLGISMNGAFVSHYPSWSEICDNEFAFGSSILL